MKTAKIIKLMLGFIIFASQLKAQLKEPSWEYPVRPGMDKWEKLKTNEEMTTICQIPEDILTSLTTEDLIRTCMAYPLLPDIFLYDNLKEGFETKLSSFNGFQELLKRKDLNSALLKIYTEMQPDLTTTQDFRDNNNTFKFIYIDLLLTQPLVISQLSETQKKEILINALNKYLTKKEIPEVYSVFNLKTTLLVVYLYTNQLQDTPVFDKNDNRLIFFEKE